jgi:hypothetical protein
MPVSPDLLRVTSLYSCKIKSRVQPPVCAHKCAVLSYCSHMLLQQQQTNLEQALPGCGHVVFCSYSMPQPGQVQ